MALYFETRIKYDKMQEDGKIKPTTEAYLVEALSFTEAEWVITEKRRPYISGDFDVSAVKKTKIAELFRSVGEKWYACKLMFIGIDEKTGQEKRNANLIYVQADTFAEAYDNLVKGMSDTMADYEIASIAETPILGIYKDDDSYAKLSAMK